MPNSITLFSQISTEILLKLALNTNQSINQSTTSWRMVCRKLFIFLSSHLKPLHGRLWLVLNFFVKHILIISFK